MYINLVKPYLTERVSTGVMIFYLIIILAKTQAALAEIYVAFLQPIQAHSGTVPRLAGGRFLPEYCRFIGRTPTDSPTPSLLAAS
jgi:hypothetical protein